ncbi:MAG: helix-turn-helix domain-containing protein [Bacteroidetes bacterium]|nr:helix-turn-helix domain-containing protein [Bacteroidota bacterium]
MNNRAYIIKAIHSALLLVFMTIFNGYGATSFSYVEDDLSVIQTSYPFIFTQEIDQNNFRQDSLNAFRERAIFAAKNNDIENASKNAELFVIYSGETNFLEYGYFKPFLEEEPFLSLVQTYSIKFNWRDFLYLFSSVIGFFIGLILLFRKNQDKWSSGLISVFMLINSVFIFHNFLYTTKLVFAAPHMLQVSATYAFLYGPLIYFYYKRITVNYQFSKKDLLHLIPTVAVLLLVIPILVLPGEEKERILFNVGTLDREPYRIIIVFGKFLSLFAYGGLMLYSYIKTNNSLPISKQARKWVRNLVLLTSVYVISYLIHGLNITEVVSWLDVFLDVQIIAMSLTMLYIGYMSYLKPNLLSVEFTKKKTKYKKSGLTPSFSLELKQELLSLLEGDKIYRENNISLAIVSDRLGTTRHNTSQVINEHFGLNFFELVNRYRIEEAMEILKNDTNKNLNIIDVAYEVGFNNKVTFNKSFRKQLSLTPSQYLSSLRAS